MRKALILLIFVPLSVMGQIFKSSNQQFVEQAIKGAMFVLKQAYQLEDSVSGQRFGRYGNDVFGTTSVLAIRTSDGIMYDNEILKPWSHDENFERYRRTHVPILTKSSRIEFGDSVWAEIEMPLDSIDASPYRLSLLNEIRGSSDGLTIKQFNKPIEGWIVWLSNDSVISKYEGHSMPELTIYKKSIAFTPDSISYGIEQPQTNKKIWGGIFVVPEQTSIGVIQFNLAGILLKSNEDDGWELLKPQYSRGAGIESKQHDELTPLDPGSNKKKNKKKK